MATPSEEFIHRAKQKPAFTLTPLHHHVMDHIYSDFGNGFAAEDVIDAMGEDAYILKSSWLTERPLRIKLLVLRSIQYLVLTDMIAESKSHKNTYNFLWLPEA